MSLTFLKVLLFYISYSLGTNSHKVICSGIHFAINAEFHQIHLTELYRFYAFLTTSQYSFKLQQERDLMFLLGEK